MAIRVRGLFLTGISIIYLVAFASLYVQVPGLYGDNGLLPARSILKPEPKTLRDFMEQPSLLRYRQRFGLTNLDSAMDAVIILGMVLSLISFMYPSQQTLFLYGLLWLLYLSIYKVGRTFLTFQWDILLLETGFLAMILAPLNLWKKRSKAHSDTVGLWLVKWLLFRLMFASGVVKLQSRCPTWWGLTALDWHYESQCIPTPLSWYFHHLPQWFNKLSVAMVFIIEIPIPFLFFSPLKGLRKFAFYSQMLLQVLIIMTGNYNFFNMLTILLCVSLWDDEDFIKLKGTQKKQSLVGRFFTIVQMILLAGLVAISLHYLSITFIPGIRVNSKINFSIAQFNEFVTNATKSSIYLGVLTLVWEIIKALVCSVVKEKGLVRKVYSLFSTLLFSGVAVWVFSVSLISHTVIDRSLQQHIPSTVTRWYYHTEQFEIVNSYGLFRRMTGVGGRPEIVILGSQDQKTWAEYEFLYKPGSLARAPPIVAPHQPRLDWQMWFAALSSIEYEPWLVSLAYRILTNEPDVLNLIGPGNPFPDSPPKYLKALKYTYHFSAVNSSQTWWSREKPLSYMGILTKEDENLLQFVDYHHLKPRKPFPSTSYLENGVRYMRSLITGINPFNFVSGIATVAVSCAVFEFARSEIDRKIVSKVKHKHAV